MPKLPDLDTAHAIGMAARRAVGGDPIPKIQPFADRERAENYARALGIVRKMLVTEDKRMRRMRKPPQDYARQMATLAAVYRAIAELHEGVQMAHGIGGY